MMPRRRLPPISASDGESVFSAKATTIPKITMLVNVGSNKDMDENTVTQILNKSIGRPIDIIEKFFV